MSQRVLNRGVVRNWTTARAGLINPAHAAAEPTAPNAEVRTGLFEAAVSEHVPYVVKRPASLERSARAFASQMMKV